MTKYSKEHIESSLKYLKEHIDSSITLYYLKKYGKNGNKHFRVFFIENNTLKEITFNIAHITGSQITKTGYIMRFNDIYDLSYALSYQMYEVNKNKFPLQEI